MLALNSTEVYDYAYKIYSIKEFFEILKKNIRLVIETNHIVRNIIKRNKEKGLLPNYSYAITSAEA